ncbi:MAG: hypothetical protein Q8P67_14320 [archaeon]|nr:hypothetical protein [archaeon]
MALADSFVCPFSDLCAAPSCLCDFSAPCASLPACCASCPAASLACALLCPASPTEASSQPWSPLLPSELAIYVSKFQIGVIDADFHSVYPIANPVS